jgi:hypothetical protein
MTQKQIYREILKNKFIKSYDGRHINKYFLISNPNFKITICEGDTKVWVDGDKEYRGEYAMTREEFINKFQD